MPIEIKMPALSPTMEEGTLAKWLVKVGDTVKSGDILAEIETDKATMEFEAIDEGVVASIDVAEGADGVKVGTVIATITGEDEGAAPQAKAPEPAVDKAAPTAEAKGEAPAPAPAPARAPASATAVPAPAPLRQPSAADAAPVAPAAEEKGARVKASPLARRIAADKGVELSAVTGSGPNGRIVRADVEGAQPGTAPAAAKPSAATAAPSAAAAPHEIKAVWYDDSIPHTVEKLSNIRKTIARRLTEAKQTIPHIYLTVDVQLDALMKLRGELNAALEARGVKLSVNDLLIKALALALEATPKCNVTFLGSDLVTYSRADISVAVSTPSGLITPIIRDAANASMSSISMQMKELAALAKDNKLKPEQYQGGTASISNMGMFGIKQLDAVINPPQAMILAVGAGEKRPYVVDGALAVATVMSATGSFDHRAIDGADGAKLMKAFKALVEKPLGLI